MSKWLKPVFLVVALLAGCGKSPSLGSHPEAHKATEALYTAITAKKTEMLDRSEQRINQLNQAGKIPPQAFESLTAIIAKARAGRWERASEQLHTFLAEQDAH